MRHTITPGKINYYPNRFNIIPAAKPEEGGYFDYPEKIMAMKQRLHSEKFSEHYNQAQLFWNSMTEIEKMHIINALSFELDHCDEPVVYERMVKRLADISLDLARAVCTKVGGPQPEDEGRVNHGNKAKGLSQFDFTPEAMGMSPTIASRNIAFLIGDGFNLGEYEAVKAALNAAGANCFTIGPKRQPVKSSGGKSVSPDHHFEGMRSTLFDAVYVPGGEHVATLLKQGRVLHWVRESFGHNKAIGATGEGVQLVKAATEVEGMQFSASADVVDCYGVVTASSVGEQPGSSPLDIASGASFVATFARGISKHRCWQRELDGLTEMVAY